MKIRKDSAQSLIWAVAKNNLDEIKALLKVGADPNSEADMYYIYNLQIFLQFPLNVYAYFASCDTCSI